MDLDELNRICKGTLIDLLNIEFTGYSGNSVEASMKVTPAHHQPAGVVHGGALITLAETVGSAGSFLQVDRDTFTVYGSVIHSQHLNPARDGILRATARQIVRHDYKHIWDVEITDEQGQLISVSRVTNSIKTR